MRREPVDISGLLELRRLQRPDKPDAVSRIVRQFLAESAERADLMQVAVLTDDPSTLERAAHALKGIAGTVGAHEVADIATRLELIGRDGQIGDAEQLVTELQAALARVRPIFEGVINSAKGAS